MAASNNGPVSAPIVADATPKDPIVASVEDIINDLNAAADMQSSRVMELRTSRRLSPRASLAKVAEDSCNRKQVKAAATPSTDGGGRDGNAKDAPRAPPPGFVSSPASRACPSCSSSLVLRVPSSANAEGAIEGRRPLRRRDGSQALEDTLGDDPEWKPVLASSLEAARSANLLLQALSFDAATREEVRVLEEARTVEGVSYCPACKVHVVATPEELDRLFESCEGETNGTAEKNGGGARSPRGDNAEWLRGSLFVAVDEAEVMALGLQRSQEAKLLEPEPTSNEVEDETDADGQDQDRRRRLQFHSGGTFNLSRGSNPATDAAKPSQHEQHEDKLPRRLQPKPTCPLEFDYEYRHKVARHAMAARIGRGYSLTEEVCDDCEMPLMYNIRDRISARKRNGGDGKEGRDGKNECVVCPKLWKKVYKYHGGKLPEPAKQVEEESPEKEVEEGKEQEGEREPEKSIVDPIDAILEEAHKEVTSPQDGTVKEAFQTVKHIQPEIAEAKQFVMQRRIMGSCGKDPIKGGGGDKESESQATASLTDHSADEEEDPTKGKKGHQHVVNEPAEIDWDELLINGRSILSKRLNEGWILSSNNCSGCYCKGTPLLLRESEGDHFQPSLEYCVVCGGTGDGMDGAYEREWELQARAQELADKAKLDAIPDWENLASNGRALLAERLKQGWTMSSVNCAGYHCNGMPLTNFEGGPDSCVVCGGLGSGTDGKYENYKKPDKVIEEEREIVSQELSRLLDMGWVLRESLCKRCLMPLVAEDEDAEHDLCILCGLIPENSPTMESDACDFVDEEIDDGDDSYLIESQDDSYLVDSYFDEEPSMVTWEKEDTPLDQAVNAPVVMFGDDNTDQAGKYLMMGWTLPDAGLCHHCHGILMNPPNSDQIGCIKRGCPSALAAAYTSLPEPYESTGPLKLIGRGFSNNVVNEEEQDFGENTKVEEDPPIVYYEEDEEQEEHDGDIFGERASYNQGLPLEVYSNGYYHDEPSILSCDDSLASSALGALLIELDNKKHELEAMVMGKADPQECARKQVEIASLIEKLARAAVAMKQQE